jgi:hypothetical protein
MNKQRKITKLEAEIKAEIKAAIEAAEATIPPASAAVHKIKTEAEKERISAACDELIKLGVLVDSGRPLNGQMMWMPNPKFTEEQQLTEQQRKALVESGCEGADLQEKLRDAASGIYLFEDHGHLTGVCHHCGQSPSQLHPVGPLVVEISAPDGGETHEFCDWECFGRWAAEAAGGELIIDAD